MAIVQLRSNLLDNQIQSEMSVRGALEGQQSGLQFAQASLGRQIDRLASGAEGSAAAQGVGGSHTLADGLNDLFNSFQSLSTDPTSMTERETLVSKAADLASQFNQFDQRLQHLTASLNDSVETDVTNANDLLSDIAKLNDQISTTELSSGGTANDLRDLRQQKLEQLGKLVQVNVVNGPNGATNISVSGTALVSGKQVSDTLQTYDSGGGKMLVRAASAGTPLALTGGSIQGTIDVRDGAVAALGGSVNSLSSLLITEINNVHAGGFSLTGSTGEKFFTGTNAADMKLNAALLGNPALVQASGVAGAVGDNRVALALAQLGDRKYDLLNGQTFGQSYGQAVAGIGQALSSVDSQLSDQQVVEKMLLRQRDSISGVSLDEEMTDLTKFQKAFAASARLITTVDEMLDSVVNLKR